MQIHLLSLGKPSMGVQFGAEPVNRSCLVSIHSAWAIQPEQLLPCPWKTSTWDKPGKKSRGLQPDFLSTDLALYIYIFIYTYTRIIIFLKLFSGLDTDFQIQGCQRNLGIYWIRKLPDMDPKCFASTLEDSWRVQQGPTIDFPKNHFVESPVSSSCSLRLHQWIPTFTCFFFKWKVSIWSHPALSSSSTSSLRQMIEAIGAHSIPKMAQLRDQELANLVWGKAVPVVVLDVDAFLGFIVEILHWTPRLDNELKRFAAHFEQSAVFSFATSEGMIISTIVKALVTNVRITTFFRLLWYLQISPCYEAKKEQTSTVCFSAPSQGPFSVFRGPIPLPKTCPLLQVMPPYWLWIVPWWRRQRDAERNICAEEARRGSISGSIIMISWY